MTRPEVADPRGHRYLEVQHCPRCGQRYRPGDFNAVDCMFLCTACDFDFYQNPLPAAVAVTVDASCLGEVLLIKRRTPPHVGRWCLPGGFIRYGEAPEAAALREVREEVGAQVRIDRLLRAGLVDYTYRGRRVWVVELGYLAYLSDRRQLSQSPTEEASEMRFVRVADALAAPELLAFPEQAGLLAAYQALSPTSD